MFRFIPVQRLLFCALFSLIFNAFVAGGDVASASHLKEQDPRDPKITKTIQYEETRETRQNGLGTLVVLPDDLVKYILSFCDLKTGTGTCALLSKNFHKLTNGIPEHIKYKSLKALASNLPPLENTDVKNIAPYVNYMKTLRQQISAIGPLTSAIKNEVALSIYETHILKADSQIKKFSTKEYNEIWTKIAFLRAISALTNELELKIDSVSDKDKFVYTSLSVNGSAMLMMSRKKLRLEIVKLLYVLNHEEIYGLDYFKDSLKKSSFFAEELSERSALDKDDIKTLLDAASAQLYCLVMRPELANNTINSKDLKDLYLQVVSKCKDFFKSIASDRDKDSTADEISEAIEKLTNILNEREI